METEVLSGHLAASTLQAGTHSHASVRFASGALLLFVLIVTAGCGVSNGDLDGGTDAGLFPDGGTPDGGSGPWSGAKAMRGSNSEPTATLLPSGKVLVAGGEGFSSDPDVYGSGPLPTAEVYDETTNTWTPTGRLTQSTGRMDHTATLLLSGKVLVTGGRTRGPRTADGVATAELYDPATDKWTATGSLAVTRHWHTATLLPSGKVLVVGGYVTGSTATAELYDPATSTFQPTGSLAQARYHHTATLLPSGKVLVAGGWHESKIVTATELYDPETGSWSLTGSLSRDRYRHTATLLPSGKVLVAGGIAEGTAALATAELYDPATGTWSATGRLVGSRLNHSAVLLPTGKVLVAGGSGSVYEAQLYDPSTGTWSAVEAPPSDLYYPRLVVVPSGKVLLVDSGRAMFYTP